MFCAGWAVYGRCSDIEFAGTILVGKLVRFIVLILSCVGRGPAKRPIRRLKSRIQYLQQD